MNSWTRKAGIAASLSLIAIASIAPACAASATPHSVMSVDPPPGTSNGPCGNTRTDPGLASLWARRLATELPGVVLPKPDCVRRGGSADYVTVLWLQSDPGFLDTLRAAFGEARWYVIHASRDSVSFESEDGTIASASFSRFGYVDAEPPYVALVYGAREADRP